MEEEFTESTIVSSAPHLAAETIVSRHEETIVNQLEKTNVSNLEDQVETIVDAILHLDHIYAQNTIIALISGNKTAMFHWRLRQLALQKRIYHFVKPK